MFHYLSWKHVSRVLDSWVVKNVLSLKLIVLFISGIFMSFGSAARNVRFKCLSFQKLANRVLYTSEPWNM